MGFQCLPSIPSSCTPPLQEARVRTAFPSPCHVYHPYCLSQRPLSRTGVGWFAPGADGEEVTQVLLEEGQSIAVSVDPADKKKGGSALSCVFFFFFFLFVSFFFCVSTRGQRPCCVHASL